MMPPVRQPGHLLAALALLGTSQTASAAPFMIVGIDGKLTWNDKGQPVLSAPGRDLVVVVDIAKPGSPRIVATMPIANSVAGPPVNLALSPDGGMAIVADSVSNVADSDGKLKQVPSHELYVLDLSARRPRFVQRISSGAQPSGLSINARGTLAMVAYRGETSVGVFRITGKRLSEVGRVDVVASPSHVVFTPDGKRAFAVKQTADRVAVLDVEGEVVTHVGDLPTGSGPYNIVVTPDGSLAATSDRGVLTVIDPRGAPRVLDRIAVGAGSEGLAVSPRGDLVISVALLGSNGDKSAPGYHERGAIVPLSIAGNRLEALPPIEVGRVPEGVGFSPDGSHLYVANFYDDDVWIFRVSGSCIQDTGKRLRMPGHPASLRTSP